MISEMGQAKGTGRLPDFLIVGAMKGGTTSLATWLRAHPQVFVPVAKELHFFDQFWKRGVDWYRAQFSEAAPGTRLGEATPSYMTRPVYIERMAAVVPDVRLIAVLRNPVDRAWSQYRHMAARGERAWSHYRRFDGREGRRSFAELIELELAADPSDWRTSGMCLARGRYVEHLRSLAARFGSEQIHVALFDDLVSDPDNCFAAVCRFLGIDDRIRPIVVGQSLDPLVLMGPQASEDDHRGLLAQATARRPRRSPAAGVRRIVERLPGRARARATEARPREGPVPAAVRATLVEYFRPYNEELAAWLDVDLSTWNR